MPSWRTGRSDQYESSSGVTGRARTTRAGYRPPSLWHLTRAYGGRIQHAWVAAPSLSPAAAGALAGVSIATTAARPHAHPRSIRTFHRRTLGSAAGGAGG